MYKRQPDAIDLPESAPLADGAIIASVIPALTGVWSDAARRLTDARPLTVGPGLKTGLKMNFSDPTAVGADRVAEMVGAKSTYGAPALVIDLGTSTTFELLDEAGAFRGGIIAPGMKPVSYTHLDVYKRQEAVEVSFRGDVDDKPQRGKRNEDGGVALAPAGKPLLHGRGLPLLFLDG